MNHAGQPQRLGLIGHPVGHSISPQFQQAAFDFLGLPAVYERWDTPTEMLEERVRALRGDEFLGANVTVPHKEAVVRLVDAATPDVALTGAANSLVKEGNRLVAYNTDVGGFRRALRDELGYDARGVTAGLIGAGGAARAVAAALAQEGAVRIVVLNRGVERARLLARDLEAGLGLPLEVGPLDGSAGARLADCGLIVNCTSVGLAGNVTEGQTPLDPEVLPAGAAIVDVIANPVRTPLLQAAAAAGRPVLGGLAMLVYQGALAFELWTGRPAPVAVMMAAARHAMGLDGDGAASKSEASR